MASLNLIPAVRNTLLANATLMAYLPSGASNIIIAGNLATGRVPDNVGFPLIALQDAGTTSAGAYALPFEQNIFHVRVYDQQTAPNTVSYLNIDNIIEEVIHTLHRVSMTTQMSYAALFDVYYDNFKSPALYDDFLKLPYRFARFRAYLVRSDYAPR